MPVPRPLRACARLVLSLSLGALAALTPAGPARALFADSVVSYTPGSNPAAGFGDPNAALGAPTRNNGPFQVGDNVFDGGDVTPFNAPFQPQHVVSIGAGGELVVFFSNPLEDDPRNPFGLDLLVFGNAFFTDPNFAPIATDLFAEPGRVSVSQNGTDWAEITGAFADALYPTFGFQDTSTAFGTPGDGTLPSDVGLPVDPNADPFGLGFEALRDQIYTNAYGFSAGGVGVDIASSGLAFVHYVRISQDAGDPFATEIDAFSDVNPVPEPAGAALVAAGLALVSLLARRRPGHPDR